MSLAGKKILLGISGSIAAYKIPLLVRLLVKDGAEVKVVMTPTARDFVTPLTLSTLSKNPVLSVPFDPVDGSWNSHVELGNWADVMLIAPASATTLAKMASGISDNLLITTYLAAKCPVFFAPAMDLDMYLHPSTQANIARLISYGNFLIAPKEGELASGLCGAGRLEEPNEIFNILDSYFEKQLSLNGLSFLITAGPTLEAIDPVRYISNHSSGKMGYALALEAAERGARVTVVSGPVSIKADHPNITVIDVKSAQEMLNAADEQFPSCNVFIAAAAVADYRPSVFSDKKIKKNYGNKQVTIELTANPDILATLSAKKQQGQVVVGFALETNNALENAKIKLESKKLDMIVMNTLEDQGAGFQSDLNKVTMILRDGEQKETPLLSKSMIALMIIQTIVRSFPLQSQNL